MVTLKEAKIHLRVEMDMDDEDELIQLYITAATAAAADYLNLAELPEQVPAPVRAAVLLQVGAFYSNRESVTADAAKYAENPLYTRLLDPYRSMTA
ncbi:head-tail connector protein [Burkholderia cenocepacia]|uniref:head-tail connector protein n=1 Tax=Burkholderia cenocepacia TaxID=95486 RepID=UPI001F4A5F68|nr:head-tail connector protein [Burkholderia cenocepacia]